MSESAAEWVLLEQAIVGSDGSSAIPVYRLSTDEPATPTGTLLPPEGWTLDVPVASDAESVWMSIASVKDNIVSAWSRPSRISGKDGTDGKDGKDGKDYEWIFALSSSYKKPATPPTKQEDDYVPSPSETSDGTQWTDDATGPSAELPYEWACKRIKKDNVWGGFSEPSLWAKYSFDGEDGTPGLQGCIVRITEWAEGMEYRNDAQLETSALRYIDVVTINDNGNQLKYQCTKTHTSSEVNKPNTTGGVSYWQQVNDMVPIYTPLLLADNAVIDFLQGMQLIVHDVEPGGVIDDSNIIAGILGGPIPLFVGANTPGDAPFRVAKDGSLTATKAYITGEINAEKGVIGGFKINKDNLIAQLGTSEMLLSAEAIKFEDLLTPMSVTIGSFTDDDAYCPIKITNNDLRANKGGIYIDVPKSAGENAAIYANTGDFYGFRPKSRYLNPGTHYLEKIDTIIMAASWNGNLTLYLPNNPEPNHLIVIRKMSDNNTVYVNGNGSEILWNDSNSLVTSKSFTGRRAVTLIYNDSANAWIQWISSN